MLVSEGGGPEFDARLRVGCSYRTDERKELFALRLLFGVDLRVLRPGGVFAFCINHPAALATSDNGSLHPVSVPYLCQCRWRSANPHSVRGLIPTWHRPLV